MNMNGERVHFRLNKHRAMIHKNTKHYIALNWSSLDNSTLKKPVTYFRTYSCFQLLFQTTSYTEDI